MKNEDILARLKELAAAPELERGFQSQRACIAWANRVASLLRFDDELHERFTVYQTNINTVGLSANLQESSLNQLVSILNQAIATLENPPKITESKSMYGVDLEKVTLPTLFKIIPVRYWVLLGSLLVASFIAGIKTAETNLYKNLITGHVAPATESIKNGTTNTNSNSNISTQNKGVKADGAKSGAVSK